jgi:hypothetical protein
VCTSSPPLPLNCPFAFGVSMSPNHSFKSYPRDEKANISLKDFSLLSLWHIGYSCLLEVWNVLQIFDMLQVLLFRRWGKRVPNIRHRPMTKHLKVLMFCENCVKWTPHNYLDIGNARCNIVNIFYNIKLINSK